MSPFETVWPLRRSDLHTVSDSVFEQTHPISHLFHLSPHSLLHPLMKLKHIVLWQIKVPAIRKTSDIIECRCLALLRRNGYGNFFATANQR